MEQTSPKIGLLGLPAEIHSLIFKIICPAAQERFNPSGDDAMPGSKAWLREFGMWKETAAALRLTCRTFSTSDILQAALFHNIYYLATYHSLARIGEIAKRPDIAQLVKRVTFSVNPFHQIGEHDNFASMEFDDYNAQVSLQIRMKMYQALGEDQVAKERMLEYWKHVGGESDHGFAELVKKGAVREQIQALEEIIGERNHGERQAGYEAFKRASAANHECLLQHLLPEQSDQAAVHAQAFSGFANVETVVLSAAEADPERINELSNAWVTRKTFMGNACPEGLVEERPLFHGIGKPMPECICPDHDKQWNRFAKHVFTHSGLKPRSIVIDLPELAKDPDMFDEDSDGEDLERDPMLTVGSTERLSAFRTNDAPELSLIPSSARSITALEIGRRYERLPPPREIWTSWKSKHIGFPLEHLQLATFTCVQFTCTDLRDLLRTSKDLTYLRMTNVRIIADRPLRRVFSTVRQMREDLVFDLENIMAVDRVHMIGTPQNGYGLNAPGGIDVPVRLRRERSSSDMELIAYMEGTGEWTPLLERVWVGFDASADPAKFYKC